MLNRESLNLEVVAAAGNEDKILVHDERNRVLAQLLAAMGGEGFPIAVGVLFSDSKSTFTEDTSAHLESVRKERRHARGSAAQWPHLDCRMMPFGPSGASAIGMAVIFTH